MTSSIVDNLSKSVKIQLCESSAVLSPILFAMYVILNFLPLEDVVIILLALDFCHIGVLIYADDLLLISCTCSDLHRMTKICEDEIK